MTYTDQFDDDQLFALEAPPPVSLADKFGVPPMSVLDRRSGAWLDRKRRWLSMGIRSEVGRGGDLTFNVTDYLGANSPDPALRRKYGGAAAVGSYSARTDDFARVMRGEVGNMGDLVADGTSVFDPVVCELAYRWHTNPGDRVLDPFAGGSVRGVVASTLARHYVGVDLRGEQIAANEAQIGLCGDHLPRWIQGDSARIDDLLDPADEFDLIFSCPPYGDLERYSDLPADLSTMPADDFRDTHAAIIAAACERLRPNRFAAWVISDVRDRRGAYRGLVADTIRAFEAAGLTYHNDAVLLDQVGTAAVRAERPFRATRKLTRVHQHLLIFCKGDAKKATQRLEASEATPAPIEPEVIPHAEAEALEPTRGGGGEDCLTCTEVGRRGYCAPGCCYCGHQACYAFASWREPSWTTGAQ